MSESQTNSFDIYEIVKNRSHISDAINTLKNTLPFVKEETLYNIIIHLLKQNKHLSLMDNFQTQSNANDMINKETDDLRQSFHPNELSQLLL